MCVTNGSATYRKHLIGLVKNEHPHGIGSQEAAINHVMNTAGGSNDHLGAFLESFHVLTDTSTTNASMALDIHKISNCDDNLLDLLSELSGGCKDQSLALLDVGFNLLENRDGESSSLSRTRLGLSDHIMTWVVMGVRETSWTAVTRHVGYRLTLDDGHNGTLLDGRGPLKSISINSCETGNGSAAEFSQ